MAHSNERENETPVVVLHSQRYAVHRFWARIPDVLPSGFVSQVAVDSSGRVHLLQRACPAVVVFDPGGAYAYAYGREVGDAHGIYCDPDDRIFVADRDSHQILVYGADGTALFRIGERHRPHWQDPFNHPADVAVAPDGRIFVADGYGNARVHRFDAQGRHELSWGKLGRGPGDFLTPHAIWVTADHRVLVADRENGRIQVFTTDGGLLGDWHGLQNPMDIFVDAAGAVFVTDQVPSLVMFGADGTCLGRCRPSLNGAHGIFGNRNGDLFLAEMNPAALTKLERLDSAADP